MFSFFQQGFPLKGTCVPIPTAPSTPCPWAAWLRWAPEFMISGLGAAKGKKPFPSAKAGVLLSSRHAGIQSWSSSGRTPPWKGAGGLHHNWKETDRGHPHLTFSLSSPASSSSLLSGQCCLWPFPPLLAAASSSDLCCLSQGVLCPPLP